MFFSPRDRQDLLWQNWHGELLPHVGRVAFQLERRRVTWVPAETEKPGQVRVLAARPDGSSGGGKEGMRWELRECWAQRQGQLRALWLPKPRVSLSPTRAGHIPCPRGASSVRSPRHQLLGGCSGFPALSCSFQLPGTTGWRDGTWLRTASIQPPVHRGASS